MTSSATGVGTSQARTDSVSTSIAVEVGQTVEYHCNPAPPSSKPFLTLPTQCTAPEPGKTAAQLTTLKADPWKAYWTTKQTLPRAGIGALENL